MKLSIVTSSYNSEKFIENFFKQINQEVSNIGLSNECEIIVVDDGSSDNTIFEIKRNIGIFKKFKFFEFSKNFGHHNAIMCGVKESEGDLTFIIDSDLEENPSLLTLFYKKIVSENVDLVVGKQEKRTRGFVDKIFGFFFYKINDFFLENSVFKNECTIRIFNMKVKKAAINAYDKSYSFQLNNLFSQIGFKKISIDIEKKRITKSNYTFKKKLSNLSSVLINYSNILIYLLIIFSIFISLISFGMIIYYLIKYFSGEIGILGFPTIIVSIWFLCGIIMISLAIVSLYLSKLLSEIRNKIKYIIKDKITN